MDESIPLRHEEPAGEAAGRNLPGPFWVVIRCASIDLDGDLTSRLGPRIGIVNDQVRKTKQLQPCSAVAFSLSRDRAVKVTKPNVQDELGSAFRGIAGVGPKNGVVKTVR